MEEIYLRTTWKPFVIYSLGLEVSFRG